MPEWDLVNAPVDLTNCDREPIHIPGAIQTHGALIACDAALDRVQRYSANLAAILSLRDSAGIVGESIEDLLGAETVHALRNALATASLSRRPALLFAVPVKGRSFDIAVHRSGSEAIIEFEATARQRTEPLNMIRTIIGRALRSATLEELTADAAKLVRALLGYDRVMVYRFEPDGSGQVIDEAKAAHLESFLGQYFPAGDIPQQARALYLRNTIRIIMDASGDRVPILPAEAEADFPLNLSDAHLRSVSPIHCEYLRNMGVSASMSISLIIDGALWGMIACHHYAAKHLDMAERAAMEMFGEFLSVQIDLMRQKLRIATARAARQALDHFLHSSSRHDDIPTLMATSLPGFLDMLAADGVGLWIGGTWSRYGATPPVSAVAELLEHLEARWDGRVWASHELCRDHERAADYCAEASGLLAIPLSQHHRDYLLFFRREFEHTLNWAGNPEKTYETGPLGDRLTPRKSFAIWKEAVRGQSRPWTEADLETAEVIRSALVEVVLRHNEIMAEERGRADLRQRMLNEELNHRVKNILAVIKSLVGQSNPTDRTIDDYIAILRGRIDALAIAHDQVVRGGGGGMVRDLLQAELRPYGSHAAAVSLEGPAVWVDTTAFTVLALVFHELATNAVKYGALSRPEGRLSVHWSVDAAGDCRLEWRESGGPPVTAPSRRGFGSTLIGRSIPHDLGGEADIVYHPEGLRGVFRIPAAKISAADAVPDPADRIELAVERASVTPSDAVTALPVLLVEDQILIAMDAEAMLGELGFTNVSTAASVTEALSRIETLAPAAAILDVNLGADTSLAVAEKLRQRRTPFLFATGYGDGSIIPEAFSDVRVIRKPYAAGELSASLMELFAAR
jgi:light-regulated signal transduction histidine kinase (bacteriophytochrome)/CheY-like chemotaxis protein